MASQENALQRIITKCWGDAAFKERLLADPAATLAAEGVQVPEGVTVHVAVDSEDVRTLVIPLPPPAGLSDDELRTIAAGVLSPIVDVVCPWDCPAYRYTPPMDPSSYWKPGPDASWERPDASWER